MTPEDYQRVKELFGAALEREPRARAAFLDQECGVGTPLRSEVESLLAAHDNGSFLEAPAFRLGEDAGTPERALSEGDAVGRYRIIALLGAGGMGEVYLAEDLRLRRRIALKLLPANLSRDPDRLRRFEQEARAASALSHPNVCVIHEVSETDDGRHFLAMEYVEGASLRERLERGREAGTRLPLLEVLDVAAQAAAGL